MTEQELKNKISKCEDKIEDYNSDITTIKNQITNYEVLKNKYIAYREDFEINQTDRILLAGEISAIPNQTKIAEPFSEALSDLLNGEYFQSAYSGINDAIDFLHKQIGDLYEDIEDKKRLLTQQENSLTYYEKALKNFGF